MQKGRREESDRKKLKERLQTALMVNGSEIVCLQKKHLRKLNLKKLLAEIQLVVS